VPITHEQAAKLREQAGRHVRYFHRLRARLEQLGYTPADPLYRAVADVANAAQGFALTARYYSCTSGVGRKE